MPITRVGVGLPHQFLFHRGLICQDTSRPLPAPLCQIRQARHLLLGDLSPRSLRLRDDNQVEYMMFVKEPTQKKKQVLKIYRYQWRLVMIIRWLYQTPTTA